MLRTIMVAQNVRRIESLNSFSEEIIVTVVGAAILTAVGLVWRNLLSPRWQRYTVRKRTQRLLKAIYDLAEGDPDAIVDSIEVAERASVSHAEEDFYPLARQLLRTRLIEQRGMGVIEHVGAFTSYSITPTGIHAVMQQRLPN